MTYRIIFTEYRITDLRYNYWTDSPNVQGILGETLHIFHYKYSFPGHKYSARVIIDLEHNIVAARRRYV